MSANSISGERDSQISNLYVLSCAYEALVTRIHQPFVSAESPVPRLSDQVFRFDLSLQTRPSAAAYGPQTASGVSGAVHQIQGDRNRIGNQSGGVDIFGHVSSVDGSIVGRDQTVGAPLGGRT